MFGALVLLHARGMNGPSYWQWPWRGYRGIVPYALLAAAGIPYAIVVFRRSRSILPAILMLMVSVAAYELVQRACDTMDLPFTRVITIVSDPGSTGYFTHAREFVESGRTLRDFLHGYAGQMASFTLHARNKPPGSILFYVPFLKVAATPESAALYAGLTVALLATLSVPATYLLILELTGDRSIALLGATFMAMTPGLVLFMPEFDQVYPVVTSALVICWSRALSTRKSIYAIAFGVILAAICFVTFNLLVMGVFLGLFTLWRMGPKGPPGWITALRQTAVAVGCAALIYLLLFAWSGFNPIATFRAGVANHAQDMPATHRNWPGTIPFDLTDFAMGMGWIGAILAAFYVARPDGKLPAGLALLCIAEPLAAAAAGVLQGETARVWIFILPLVMVLIGAELARWPVRIRWVPLACLWVLTTIIAQGMVLV